MKKIVFNTNRDRQGADRLPLMQMSYTDRSSPLRSRFVRREQTAGSALACGTATAGPGGPARTRRSAPPRGEGFSSQLLVVLIIGFAALLNAQAPASADLTVLPVQGNVYMINGAGGNIAVQIGPMGIVVVDTGLAQNADKVVAAIRKLSDKPIQYIVNTHMHPDHTGGNAALRKAGVTITGANVAGNLTDAGVGAQIIAHENVLNRLSAPTGKQAVAPPEAW